MPRINELGKVKVEKPEVLPETSKKEVIGRTSTGFSVNLAPVNRALAALLLAFNAKRAAAQDTVTPQIFKFATFDQWSDSVLAFACGISLVFVTVVLISACFFSKNSRRINSMVDQLNVVNSRLERLELEAVAARTAVTPPVRLENPPAYTDLIPPQEPVIQADVPPVNPDLTAILDQLEQSLERRITETSDDQSSISSGNSYFEYEQYAEEQATTPM